MTDVKIFENFCPSKLLSYDERVQDFAKGQLSSLENEETTAQTGQTSTQGLNKKTMIGMHCKHIENCVDPRNSSE